MHECLIDLYLQLKSKTSKQQPKHLEMYKIK